MKRILVLSVGLTLLVFVASAQYAPSSTASTVAAAEINGKLNHREASGVPTANCTVGKDVYTDTSNGDLYWCTSTNIWTLKGAQGSPGTPGAAGSPGGVANDIEINSAGSTFGGIHNATTTNKFLTQSGNGATANAAAFLVIQAGDVPTLNQATTNTAGGLSGSALSGDVTNSGNTVSLIASKRLKTCVIDNDTQSATALTAAQFSGGCVISTASHIIEIDVIGGTGVLTSSAAAPTVTGASSIQIGRFTPSSGTSTPSLMSGLLATVSGKACVLPTAGSATCGVMGVTQAGASLAISTATLSAGDMIYVSAATPDTVQTWFRAIVLYTVD